MDNTDPRYAGPECKCPVCIGEHHCYGNPWLTFVNGRKFGEVRRTCPVHGDLPLYWFKLKHHQGALAVGQTCDLLFDNGHTRLWMSRCSKADGEPFNNKVTVETLRSGGEWEVYRVYEAR